MYIYNSYYYYAFRDGASTCDMVPWTFRPLTNKITSYLGKTSQSVPTSLIFMNPNRDHKTLLTLKFNFTLNLIQMLELLFQKI